MQIAFGFSRIPGRQLFIIGEFVIADHLRGQIGLANFVLPKFYQLAGGHHQDPLPLSQGVFLYKSEANFSFAGSHSIGVDNSVMFADDAQCPAETVQLKVGQFHLAEDDLVGRIPSFAEQFQQRP